MNDSVLFLASMTLFGLAMLAVGWTLRGHKAYAQGYEAARRVWDDRNRDGGAPLGVG